MSFISNFIVEIKCVSSFLVSAISIDLLDALNVNELVGGNELLESFLKVVIAIAALIQIIRSRKEKIKKNGKSS